MNRLLNILVGDTYLFRKPDEDTEHLWVVLTEPDKDDEVLIANLTSRRQGSDATVTLHPGDHPFIRHETVINYQEAFYTSSQALTEAVEGSAARTQEPFQQAVLERIQKGIGTSPHTQSKINKRFSQPR